MELPELNEMNEIFGYRNFYLSSYSVFLFQCLSSFSVYPLPVSTRKLIVITDCWLFYSPCTRLSER